MTELMIYDSVSGPVAYDRAGRTFFIRVEGERSVPVGVHGPWALVDRFGEPDEKKGARK